MSRWGRWGRWPRRWGGGKTLAQRLYESMRDGRGEGYYQNLDDETVANKELRCIALAVARAQRCQMRAGAQAHPIASTDMLPEWEQRLGRTPDPRELDSERRAALDGIQAGTLEPNADNIVAALTKTLGGEVPVLFTSKARVRTFAAPVTVTPLAVLTAVLGGGLSVGTWYIGLAGEKADGTIYLASNTGSLSVALASAGTIRVSPVPLSIWPAGVERVRYYLSVTANNATSLAYVASGTGGAIELSMPPANVSIGGLHHIGVQVAKTTWDDALKKQKMSNLLATMLSSWTTFDFITSSPFILGTSTASGASELGRGAL